MDFSRLSSVFEIYSSSSDAYAKVKFPQLWNKIIHPRVTDTSEVLTIISTFAL
jgi:hypothetical protein